MKIEDIKPDDVIVRTRDKILFKVAEVTPEGKIMQSANGKMNEVFCIFQEPKTMSFCSEEDYEPATDEQRRYMDSKLADFYGTNQEAKSRRIIALASIIGDLKQENNALIERVKKLTDDNTRMAKRIDSSRSLSDLTEALDKMEALERDCNFFRKEYDHGQRLYESLFNQHDLQRKELNVVREERDEAKEQYKDLQQKYEELSQQLNTANSKNKNADKRLDEADEEYYTLSSLFEVAESRIARFEKSTFERMEHDCPYGVKAKVGSSVCFHCEHHIKYDFGNTKTVLCAYNYDKEKEKQQEIEKKPKIKNHNEN